MDHPRFNECYLVQAFDGQEHFDSAYFVPEDIYQFYKPEIMGSKRFSEENYPSAQ
jgi:hypothetical protein